MKWYWWVLIVVVVVIIVGLLLKKNNSKTIAVNNTSTAPVFNPYVLDPITARTFQQGNVVNKYSCPEGFSLYTNSLNGHSICVKLSTGEVKDVIKS